jgi:hypothetical protein
MLQKRVHRLSIGYMGSMSYNYIRENSVEKVTVTLDSFRKHGSY